MAETDTVPAPRQSSTRERLIDAAIELIDERGGSLRVNVRDIAARAGCAPPNLYNHFPDFGALLNAAFRQVFVDFQRRVPERMVSEAATGPLVRRAALAFSEYCLEHPGWLNCLYFERHELPLDPETADAADHAGTQMIGLIKMASTRPLSDREAARITRLIHSYLLGELSPILTGRVDPGDSATIASRLANGAQALFEALIAALPSDIEGLPEWQS